MIVTRLLFETMLQTWPHRHAPVRGTGRGKERTKLLLMMAVFAACWFLPVGSERFMSAVGEGLKWYAEEHVLLGLVPAFFIAGAISVFVSQGAVMKYLGPSASKLVAYPVVAMSGTILAVCSCTVPPLFASIHKRGAGLGPATALLYSGPAIMLVIRSVLGTGKTLAFIGLVVVLSTVAGLLYGALF